MSRLNPMRVEKTVVASQLNWRKSCNSKPVLESHLDLLREGSFCDVTFIVGPSKERISCHQLFLKARSSVFQLMFTEQKRSGHSEDIPLEEVDTEIFIKFLEFIYADTFEADVSEALELLQLAHMYDVQLLVSRCEKFLENEVTLDHMFQSARKYDKFEHMNKVDFLADLLAHFPSGSDKKKSLASRPKVITPRQPAHNQNNPARPPPPGSVPLYSGDFNNYEIIRRTYNGILYEHLDVSIRVMDDSVGLPERTVDKLRPESKHKNVVLSGIGLYCPKSTNVNRRNTCKSTRAFRIIVYAGNGQGQVYDEIPCSPYDIIVAEGKMNEIKFNPAFPVGSRKYLEFTVQDVSKCPDTCTSGDHDYEARDFGNIQRTVTTTVGSNYFVLVGSSSVVIEDELSGRYSQPQLIYKLNLKEL